MLSGIPTPALAINANQTITSEGWRLSPTDGWSCNQVCSAVGLSCSESDQLAHNGDVSSSTGIQSIMNMLGTSCTAVTGNWQMAKNVPARSPGGTCSFTSPTRVTLSHYSCAAQNTYRLCYCSGITKSSCFRMSLHIIALKNNQLWSDINLNSHYLPRI